ncbi:MAG: diacylglycerol kinase family protein [Bacteroidota bacterium]
MQNKKQKFSLRKRLKSFVFAFAGMKILQKEEHNFRIHLMAAILVVATGFILKISSYEWIAIVLAIGFVFVVEILNTAIENITDFISPDEHPSIKRIKDMAAAAVLVSAIVAVIIGLIVFLPEVFSLF